MSIYLCLCLCLCLYSQSHRFNDVSVYATVSVSVGIIAKDLASTAARNKLPTSTCRNGWIIGS